MAYVTDFECKQCRQTKREVRHGSGVCAECRATDADQQRRIHLAGLRELTIEQRLERIEAQLYDLNADGRLSVLERERDQYA